MKLTELSARDLRRAAEIKDNIERLQTELKNIFGIEEPGQTMTFKVTKTRPLTIEPSQPRLTKIRRKMSAAARAKISAAAKKRWKKVWDKGGTHL